MKRRMICVVLSVLLMAVAVQAGVQQHPIGIQIWIPDTWTMETEDDLLMTTSPDEGAIVILMVLKAQNLDVAADEMDRELGKIIRNIQTTKPVENITINGLKGAVEEGIGTIDGVRIDWMSGLFYHRNHVLMVLGFAESAKYTSYEQMLVEMFSSLKPY